MSYLTEVKRYLAEHPILNLSGHFYPCTEEEIAELRKYVCVRTTRRTFCEQVNRSFNVSLICIFSREIFKTY